MITIDDPDLEAMLRVIEQETGEPPAVVLRRAMARALDGRAANLVRRTPAALGELTARRAEASGAEEALSVWALMGEMAGSVDGPADWSEEHDHYIHGVSKRNPDA